MSQTPFARRVVFALLSAALLAPRAPLAAPVPVRDLVTVEGTDSVELIGYGLVVGLNGTGDGRTISYTQQSIRNLLERMGLTVDGRRIRPKNIASAMVAARISPWDRPGSLVDLTVSSIGDATSLAGGYLLLTELRGPDGVLYATGQGSMSVGGFDVRSFSGSRVRRNYVTSGRVPEGGRIVLATEYEMPRGQGVHLHLDEPDFRQSVLIAEALNGHFGGSNAVRAVDAGRVLLDLASLPDPDDFAGTMAALHEVTVEPVIPAKVVINERTGTLVAGGAVRVQTATVSHGNLQVRIDSTPFVSQPAPFSATGQTTTVQEDRIGVAEPTGSVVSLPEATSADELARALNALGVEPRDLISIFQALKEAGALSAKLEIL